jgi:uncharacterized membrane protein SpoIIM required for sporulation
MTVGDFEHKNRPRWEEYDRLLGQFEKGRREPGMEQLPRLFRELCLDLSLARARMYGGGVTERLNELVIRGHNALHRHRRVTREEIVRFLMVDFPRAVRADWRLLVLCSLSFWLPFLAMMLSVAHDVRWVQAVLGAEGMASMEQMYGSQEEQISHLRATYGSNFMMFCFYIYNNVAIDFRIFAGGMAAGVGTLFFLLFNGIYIGAAAGYVNAVGNPESFWSFVSGHSSFELIGMIVAGMAGMRLGLAILRPGRLPRVRALAAAAREAMPLIYGAALLTVLAAAVEGFWSAQRVAPEIKYAVGIAGWLLHGAYFTLAGKGGRDAA